VLKISATSYKALLGLSIHAKPISVGRLLVREILLDTDPALAKGRFSIYFRS